MKTRGEQDMNEEQIKELCKYVIDNGDRQISDVQKELLKQAVDKSSTWQELMMVALVYSRTGEI